MARPISKTTKFILALPRNLPAKEVLSKAKAAGLATSESNVHRVRRLHGGAKGAAKSAAKPAAGRRSVRATKRGRVSVATSPAGGSRANAEDLLRAVAAEVGLGHALEVLQGERARVRRVLGG
jgi:hypothetical protein